MEAVVILAIFTLVFTIRAIYIMKKQRRQNGQNGGCWIFFF